MARLKIITDQDFLHNVCKPVTDFGARLHRLLDDMRETLENIQGAGLAAPQVGVLWRACIVATDNGIVELINPEMVLESNPKTAEEACLSIPNQSGFVSRPQRSTVSAYDRNGNQILVKFRGFSSACASHELDHLNGILYIDKLAQTNGGTK